MSDALTRSELTVAEAFNAQGVALKDPARSRSGIRCDDGVVVIGMELGDVRAAADGFYCLLWVPTSAKRATGVDWSSMKERLEHCRLAARHGGADGLLIEAGAVLTERGILRLRVARRGAEYWASWGRVARSGVAAREESHAQSRTCTA